MKTEIEKIRKNFENYIVNNNLKAVIIGISGGLDSAVNAALLFPITRKLKIPIIGRYIHIDSNKPAERNTANAIGKAFCNDFRMVDLTSSWKFFPTDSFETTPIRSGNIKARMRMMYLRDLAHAHSGIMIDNSNFTEYNLGFFTIADGGDYSPLFYYWKTEVYAIAEELKKEYNDSYKGDCLQMAIDMIPTDGLGISSSDLEQIGAESYAQVDRVLQEILKLKDLNYNHVYIKERIIETLSIDSQIIENVFNRHFTSEFKRKQLPIKITREVIK